LKYNNIIHQNIFIYFFDSILQKFLEIVLHS